MRADRLCSEVAALHLHQKLNAPTMESGVMCLSQPTINPIFR
jgi:hypothetical protein